MITIWISISHDVNTTDTDGCQTLVLQSSPGFAPIDMMIPITDGLFNNDGNVARSALVIYHEAQELLER